MSRSKEGIDSNEEPNQQTTEPTSTKPQTGTLNERLGAHGQTDYTPGRESSREFPRRTTSARERSERFTPQQGVTEPRYGNRYGRAGTSYENRGESGSRYRQSENLYGTRRGYRGGDEDFYSSDYADRGSYGRGSRYSSSGRTGESQTDYSRRYGSGSENRGQYNRGSYRDHTEQQRHAPERHRGVSERAFDPVRENKDYYTERDDYSDQYNRETLSGRSGSYQSDYDPVRGGYATDYERYDTDSDFDERSGQRQGRRNELRCADIMTKDVTHCSPLTTIREVADKMDDENVGSIPVIDNARVVGIITDRDIVCRVLAEGRDTRSVTVADVMSEDIVTCTPDESVHSAIRKMGENQVRRIPVCDMNGRLRGIIAMADVALEAERDRELADALERISQPTPNQSRKR